MKILKGDTVYLRSGKDVANKASRLQSAMNISDDAKFQEAREKMTMAEQIEMANKEHGVRGKVLRVLPKDGKVVVQGVNMVTKHQKPRATSGAGQVQQGGRIKMEAAVPISRVMLVCSNCDKPTRVELRPREETRRTLTGEKTVTVQDRYCKHCQERITAQSE